MISSPLKIVTAITATSAIVVGGLYFTHIHDQPLPYFTRTVKEYSIGNVCVIPSAKNSYVAGISSTHLFIGNEKSNRLRAFGFKDRKLTLSNLHSSTTTGESSFIHVDSPYYYIMNREVPALCYSRMDKPDQIITVPDVIPFVQCIPLSTTSYILRAINGANENTIVKIKSHAPFLTEGMHILEKQQEGLFSTAGKLHYSPALHQLIYLYYYRNEYITIDTNLVVLARSLTLDSNRQARTKVVELRPGRYTLANPPAVVNRLSCVFEDDLFVCSTVRGIGEQEKHFESHSVIDVYNLQEKVYTSSFYLNDYHHQKPTSFRMSKNKIIVVYDDAVLIHFIDRDPITGNTLETSNETKNILPAGRMFNALVEN